MVIYEKYCRKCRNKTTQRVHKINVLRGLKLQCLCCGFISERYFNANKLKEIKQLE